MSDPTRDRLATLLVEAQQGGYVCEIPETVVADRLITAGVRLDPAPDALPSHGLCIPVDGLEEVIEAVLGDHTPRDWSKCSACDWTPYGEHGTTWTPHLARAILARLAPSEEARS